MKNRVDFIDWLKAVGMFLIVFGHIFNEPYHQFTQPVYPKQLGVAFFVFVMGWGLAHETRPHWQAVYNRLFPMYFWGICIAIFISVIYTFTLGKVALSNYMPFVLGINVFVNFFPANPTTWFIGTYLHLLVFWALALRRLKITPMIILIIMLTECLIRAVFIDINRTMTGYMLMTNWLTLFSLGMYLTQQRDTNNQQLIGYSILVVWLAFIALWALLTNQLDLSYSFPFRKFPGLNTPLTALFLASAISVVYITNTLFAFAVFSRLKANAVVRFFSRNTIIIFIAHMPLYDGVHSFAELFIERGDGKKVIIVFILYVGLAIISELLHKLIDMNKLKKQLLSRISS